jgi:hypothetical protein
MKVDSINVTDSNNATPEVIAAWKEKYPTGVYELVVPSDDIVLEQQESGPPKKITTPKYKAWIRKPTRNEMRELTSKNTDPITYSEIALDMLWLGGDKEIKTDDEAFYSVMGTIQSVLDIKDAELKKL